MSDLATIGLEAVHSIGLGQYEDVEGHPHKAKTLCPLYYAFTYNVGGYQTLTYEVDEGFITDFASVPRPFTAFITRRGKHSRAAVLHDWFYHMKFVSREEADYIFYLCLLGDGVNSYVAWSMYKSVKLFGGSRWKKRNKFIAN